MKQSRPLFDHFSIISSLFRWTLLVIPVALSVGSLVAVIHLRWDNPWLLFLLPLAGLLIWALYTFLGKNSDGGNNLIIDEIHQPGGGVPARMAPLVLATTIITHLFGGSAGREGTAVQIGGSMAGLFGRICKLSKEDLSVLLMAGIAAGFGAVFGTPVTGAIFALEVLVAGRIRHEALLPCFIASVLADMTCTAWGIHHTHYPIDFSAPSLSVVLLLKVIVAGALFGLTGFLFAETTHAIRNYSHKWIRPKWLIPVAGGLIIIGGAWLLGTEDYLSLGVTNPGPDAVSIVSCFHAGGATWFSWLWKLLFTAITLGTGFKGGEVTPLFFIGAALGNALAMAGGMPVDLLAGLGFIAVFAGATNTPIACTMMGVELFGAGNVLYYAVACFTAYVFSGRSGIYSAQKTGASKY
jgi:H+/Cl- antiporter ClcA